MEGMDRPSVQPRSGGIIDNVLPSSERRREMKFEEIKKWALHPGVVSGCVFVIVFAMLAIAKPPLIMKDGKIKWSMVFLGSLIVSCIVLGLSYYFQ